MVVVFAFLLFFISALFLLRAGRRRRRRPPLPPGPKGLPLVGNLFQLGSKPHRTLHALSASHGSAGLLGLRLGAVDAVVISSSSAAAKCFRHHDAALSGRPANSIGRHITYNFEDLIMAPYGPRWRALRKLCSVHLLSAKALDGFREVREGEAARLARVVLASGSEAAVDIGRAVNACVMNTLARVLVGRRAVAGGEEAAEFMELVAEITRLAGKFNVGDFIPGIDWLDLQGLNKKMKKIRERFGDFLEKIIEEHRLNGINHAKDFLSVLIKINEDVGEKHDELTNINIKAMLQDMFIAGTDTTSITIEWSIAELLRHPHLLARAQLELDAIAGRDRLVSESDLPKLPFLHAIVKETLRLHPALPLAVPHMTTESFEIDGYRVPKGAHLLLNIWAIGRDEASWPDDPREFKPDRFASGSPQENVDVKGSDFELMPFGAGRRICAGMNLGLRVVHLVMATLLHSFDWVVEGGGEAVDMEESFGATMRKTRPVMVKAVPRLTPQAYEL